MGDQHGWNREANVVVDEEMIWQNELVRILELAVLPKTVEVAENCMKVIVEHATPLVAQKVQSVLNSLTSGKSTLSLLKLGIHH